MRYIFLALLLSGCTTVQYKSPEDYYRQRQAEDSINFDFPSKNNMLDSPDGSSYYNRRVEFFGATY